MRVEPILPDAPAGPSFGETLRQARGGNDVGTFAQALDALGSALTSANRAEDAFAYGRGTLEAAVYERAQADVALSVATATAQRITQAVQSILNMQV